MSNKSRNISPEKSKIKLVVYMPNFPNDIPHTYYSFPGDEKKGIEFTMNRMSERLLSGKWQNAYKTAVFYDNQDRTAKALRKHVWGKRTE